MRILRQISVLAVAAAIVAGCRDAPPTPPRMSEAMPGLPLPPLSAVVSRSGGADALQIVFRSSLPPDSMAAYYRGVLSRGVWNLVSDTRTRDGTIALYAERDGPPLWVTIRSDSLSSGTILTLGGAVPAARPGTAPAAPDTTTPS